MKLLLIHLSDLHFSSDENPLTGRSDELVAPVKDLRHDLDACCVLVTGDIARTGAEDEYLQASEFCSALHNALQREIDVERSPRWYYVPGNHDCNLRNAKGARKAVAGQVRDAPDIGMDDSVQELALSVQDNFYRWLEMFPDYEEAQDGVFSRTNLKRRGTNIVLNLINTAWLSPKQESQGDVVIPPGMIDGQRPACDLSITLMHHPFRWFEEGNRREVVGRIEGMSDLIFTGHEHDADYFSLQRLGYEKSRYFEGSVLQRRDGGEPSGFNVVAVDTDKEALQVYHFVVSEDRVRLEVAGEDEWSTYPLARVESGRRFTETTDTINWLKDPGLNLTHREKENVELSDFFVYPDLDPIEHGERTKPLVRSDNVLGHVLDQGHVLVTGEEKSGKTALARTLYSDLREEGYVTVYLEGGDLEGHEEDDVRRVIRSALESHYRDPDWDRYASLDRAERAVIVDDFEAFTGNRSAVVSFLNKYAEQVVILADSLHFRASELDTGLTSAGSGGRLARYEIAPFGHELRDSLVKRWFSIGEPASWEEDPKYAQRIVNAKRKVDTVLGEDYVPPRPDLILTILQGAEAGQPLEPRVGTYAAYYEVLITRSLAEVSNIPGYDLKTAYLARLAYWLHSNQEEWISEESFHELHGAFCSERDLELPFIDLVGELVEHGVLETKGNRYRFHHDYYYYYFAASYIAETYDSQQLEREIDRLATQLHVGRLANILVFITHLSKNPVILDTILKHAKGIYEEYDVAPLESLSVFDNIHEAAREAVQVTYTEEDPEDTRREIMRKRDRARRDVEDEAGDGELETPEEQGGDLAPVRELNRALKAVEILGLILKNYPSLFAERKEELLRECYELGGRAVTSVMKLVEHHREEVLEDFILLLQEEYPGFDRERLMKRSKTMLFGFAHLLTHGVVRRVSQAVGSESLEITYQKVYDRTDLAIVDLYYCSVRLDNWYSFPRALIEELHEGYSDELLVHTILERLVRDHLKLFPRNVSVRQSVCELLGIEYRTVQRSDPRREIRGRE